MTTHSPIILSDTTTESVVLLNKYEKTKNKSYVRINQMEMKTFGANIHSLLKHPFFLDSTIGAFAETAIKKDVIEVYYSKKPLPKNIQKAENIINLLGDGVQKDILCTMKNNRNYEKELYDKNNRCN